MTMVSVQPTYKAADSATFTSLDLHYEASIMYIRKSPGMPQKLYYVKSLPNEINGLAGRYG
jgi:hypothetical protein